MFISDTNQVLLGGKTLLLYKRIYQQFGVKIYLRLTDKRPYFTLVTDMVLLFVVVPNIEV